jgi:hypothetical protein
MTASGQHGADVRGLELPGQLAIDFPPALPRPALHDHMMLVLSPCGHWWQGNRSPRDEKEPLPPYVACGRCGKQGMPVVLTVWEEEGEGGNA